MKGKDVMVNPEYIFIDDKGNHFLKDDLYGATLVQNIKFDVQIVVEEKNESGLKGGLQVAGVLNIGGGSGNESINQNTSRIQFSVPVKYPVSKSTKREGGAGPVYSH